MPERVSHALGSAGKVPVVFTVGASTPRKTTLMQRAGSGTPPPPDFAEALREVDALDAFRAMGPAMQRELAYVECAEREKRVDRQTRSK